MTPPVPILTTTLGISPELLPKVLAGLESGLYERVGGVIRRADNGQVVAWLRNIDGGSVDASIGAGLGPLAQLATATALLNLSVSAIGYAVMMRRLDVIESRLDAIAGTVESINRKLDLAFYANLRAALDMARSAFEMQDLANRRSSAMQPIHRLHEAQHHYLGLVDDDFEAGGWAVAEHLGTLILACVSTARCYAELGEMETAQRTLSEGLRAIEPRVRRYYDSIIGVSPALFLHPGLTPAIPFRRMADLMRSQNPALADAQIVDSLREGIWAVATEGLDAALKRLPPAVWTPHLHGVKRKGPFIAPTRAEEVRTRQLERLSEAFGKVEWLSEAMRCAEGFVLELEYLDAAGIDLDTWQRLPLPDDAAAAGLVWLLPQDSELFGDGSWAA